MNGGGGTEVVVVVRFHRTDDAEIVGALTDVREQLGDFETALPVPFERERRADKELLFVADGLAMVAGEVGFGVEGIDLGNPAGHVHEDDALGFGGEVGCLGGHGIVGGQRVRDHAGHEEGASEEGADDLTARWVHELLDKKEFVAAEEGVEEAR